MNGYKVIESEGPETRFPGLPTENAPQDDVIHCFLRLIADDARAGILQSMAPSSVSRPTAPCRTSQKKNLMRGGANVFHTSRTPSGLEQPKNIAPYADRVLPAGRQSPRKDIRHALFQLNMFQQLT